MTEGVEEAIAFLTPLVANETQAWNVWNAINGNEAFVKTFISLHAVLPPLTEEEAIAKWPELAPRIEAMQLAEDGSNHREVREFLIDGHYAYDVDYFDVLSGYTGIQKYTDPFTVRPGQVVIITARHRGVPVIVVDPVKDGVCLVCGGAVLNSGEHVDPERHAVVDLYAEAPGKDDEA